MKMNLSSHIWVERYKPLSLAECILPTRIKKIFQVFLDSGEITNYTAVGVAGCGKTSTTLAILNELNIDFLLINASSENGVDTIRTKVVDYASRKSLSGGYRVIVLDEADFLSSSAQATLRGIIEEFADNCRFVLTGNFSSKIEDSLKSRCPVIDFSFTREEKREMLGLFSTRIKKILTENDITYDKSELGKFIINRFPDMRSVLNVLQQNSLDGVLKLGCVGTTSDEKLNILFEAIKAKKFNDVRKWCAENIDNDTHILRTVMYKKMINLLTNESKPPLIMILNDYDRYENNVSDTEVHAVAMCLDIMSQCEFRD